MHLDWSSTKPGFATEDMTIIAKDLLSERGRTNDGEFESKVC